MNEFFLKLENIRAQGRPKGTIIQPKNSKPFVSFYKAKQDKEYEAEILESYKSVAQPEREQVYFDGYLEVWITAFFPIPKSTTKAKREQMLLGKILPTKMDIDNVIKSVLDALNEEAYPDDRNIIKVHGDKCWAKDESEVGILIAIKEL